MISLYHISLLHRLIKEGSVKVCRNNTKNCGCDCSSDSNVKRTILGPFEGIDSADIPKNPIKQGIAIIPFSSGVFPVVLVTTTDGLANEASLLGFGTTVTGCPITGNTIDLTNFLETEAFSVPHKGQITAISASFTTFAGNLITGIVTARAQIYHAAANSNVFTPTNVFVDLSPSLTEITVVKGLKNLISPVLVEAGDHLLLAFSATATGNGDLSNFINGNASAGITIVL